MPDLTEAPTEAGQTFCFGPYRVSLAERKIWRQEGIVRLTPKVFDTLAILLQNRHRVMSKQELLDAVWPDRFVDEANLTQNISVLRKALGETDSATKYIATFPGKGYRFIAEVEESSVLQGNHNSALHAFEVAAVTPAHRTTRFKRPIFATGAVILLLLVGLFVLYRHATSQGLLLGPAQSFTHIAGRAYQPALSPDGKRVAFVLHDSLSGPKRLAIQNIGEQSQPYILPSQTNDMFSPAWSPDGTKLALLQFDGSKLNVVIRGTNGDTTVVVDIFPHRYELTSRQLDWSPDGRLLAISDKESDEKPFHIELVHIAEKRKIPLTQPPALSDGDFSPRFSPDGRKLAFVRQIATGVTSTYFLDLPGSDPKEVLQLTRAVGDIDWTPNSNAIVLSSGDPGKGYLWRVKVDTPRQAEQSSAIDDAPVQFSIGRKSGEIVFGNYAPAQNVWRASIDPQRGPSEWHPWISSKANNYFPVYSHNGHEVAFVSQRSGDNQVWIKNSEGQERQLTFGDLRPWYASWTRNDDKIAFSSLRYRKAYTVDSRNGTLSVVPISEKVGSHTAISLDGDFIYFVRRFYIFAAPRTGGAPPKQITDEGGSPLRLSSDGRWLYYTRNRFSNEIWRVDTTTGYAEWITSRLRAGCWSAWAVGQNTLIYLAATDSATATTLERLDLQSGKLSSFGRLPARPPALGMGALALSPDGKSLLAVVAEPGSGDLKKISEVPWQAAIPQ